MAKRLTAADRAKLQNEADIAAIKKASGFLSASREIILDDLEGWRKVSMLDFFKQGRGNRLELKTLEEMRLLSDYHQRWIKKIKVKDDIDGQTITFDGLDVLAVVEKAGKSLKMWGDEGDDHKHIHYHAGALAGVPTEVLEARLVDLTTRELEES